jgi:hypothetical protein
LGDAEYPNRHGVHDADDDLNELHGRIVSPPSASSTARSSATRPGS